MTYSCYIHIDISPVVLTMCGSPQLTMDTPTHILVNLNTQWLHSLRYIVTFATLVYTPSFLRMRVQRKIYSLLVQVYSLVIATCKTYSSGSQDPSVLCSIKIIAAKLLIQNN